MKRWGTISYNIYCNFTNYGSALQTWALHQAIKKLGDTPVLVDYCPDILADKNPLNPYKNMWDKDDEAKRMVELTFPAIRENYEKFDCFYCNRFTRTSQKYTSQNFGEIGQEKIDGFICGSDTIFCPDEFGFDDGYYANYPEMKGKSVSYAASFGDFRFDERSYRILDERLGNFKAIGLRENQMVPYVRKRVGIPVMRTIDPTLLLTSDDYDTLASERQYEAPYLLLYARRYNRNMEAYAERLAMEKGWKIVEISLRATNTEKGHIMRYDAGVEEFLSLVKHAEYLVTNSYHGMIFAFQYRRPVSIFSREQGDVKITGLLSLLDMKERISAQTQAETPFCIVDETDYDRVHSVIERERAQSLRFLQSELQWLNRDEGGMRIVS